MKKNLKRIISLFLIAITFVLSGCSLVPDNDTPTEPPQTVTYTVDYTYSSFNMEEGQSGTPSLTFKVNGQVGDPMALTYTSSNTAVATVNSAGLITAVGAGTCTITASIGSGENETKDTIVISVEGTPEYFVDFTGTLIYIEAGQQATPQIIFKIDGEISSSSYLSFTSSNTAIATVNSSGVVTAKKEGTCTITASIGSGTKKASDTITIFVTPAPPAPEYAVNYTNSAISIEIGQSATPIITFTENGNNASTTLLTYSSSNTSIATVNANGLITAVALGSCTITASIGTGNDRVFDTITVTIIPVSIPSNPAVAYTISSGSNGADFIIDFPSGKDITILQITDTQTINYYYSRTTARQNQIRNAFFSGGLSTSHEVRAWRYIREGVERANPDIIVATGDNVYGEGDDDGAMWNEFISVMDSFRKPWLTVFGNHDNESRKGVQWQVNQLLASQYCVFKQGNMTGNSNYNVIISSGGVAKYAFYMFDNHGCRVIPLSENGAGGEGIEPDNVDIDKIKQTLGYANDQVNWMENSARSIFSAYGQVPILIFQHVPIAEYRNAMRDQYGIDWGQSLPSNPFYTNLSGDFGFARELTAGNMYREDVWVKMKNLGCKGIFVGHEHKIATSVVYGGIRLTFGLKTGTYAYHAEDMLGSTKITLDVSEKDFSVAHQFTNYAYSTNKS